MTLTVSEIFGPTFQGEGPSLGRRAAFIRLGRCNLQCSWCDTPYTWDWAGHNGKSYSAAEELTEMEPEQIVDQITAMRVPLVVITGGEPMAQQRSLIPLLRDLWYDHEIEIETNGTYMPIPEIEAFVAQWNVSPKLANSNQSEKTRIKPEVLSHFARRYNSSFKFVVKGPDDIAEIVKIQRDAQIRDRDIWIMPEGRSAFDMRWNANSVLVDVLEQGWNMTTRLHVMLWGDKRGV